MSFVIEKIGDHVQKIQKWNPEKELRDDKISYMDLSSVDKDSKILIPELVQIIPSLNAPSRARQKVKVNDVIVSTVRPNLNGVAIIDKEFNNSVSSTGFCVLRAKQTLYSKYLYYWVRTNAFISDMTNKATGASYPAVSDNIIKDSRIPLPPLPQQKKIAAILDAADTYRQKTKALIAKYDELTQSLFLEMFGDPVTNPYNWNERGLIEASKSKDDIKCGPFGTQLSKSEYQDSGVPIWGIPQINSNFTKRPTEYISEDKAIELQAYLVLPNDIVMSRKGNVGACALFPSKLIKGILHSDAIRIRVDNCKMLPVVLVWQFRLSKTLQTQVTNVSSGAIMAGINVTKLKKVVIQIPPLKLQRQFAERLQTIEAQKALAQQSLIKAEELFNSLLQKAFSEK